MQTLNNGMQFTGSLQLHVRYLQYRKSSDKQRNSISFKIPMYVLLGKLKFS